MAWRVVFLVQAEQDLIELKEYLVHYFSPEAWTLCYGKIKASIKTLRLFPEKGHIPPELEQLNLMPYRQIICGMNRIIYELRENTIYIHVVCDSRKDLKSLLFKRLLDA